MSRLAGRRLLVVGGGTRPSEDPDAPLGNGRAIAVEAAREGAAVAVSDVDQAAAEVTAGLVAANGGAALLGLARAPRGPARRGAGAAAVPQPGGLGALVPHRGGW